MFDENHYWGNAGIQLTFQHNALYVHADGFAVYGKGECAVFKCSEFLEFQDYCGILTPYGIHFLSSEYFPIVIEFHIIYR